MPPPQARRILRCSALLTRGGWIEDAHVALDADGAVTGITAGAPAEALPVESLGGYVLPGFPNAHSHAFQYAMAGLAEHLPAAAAADDFWSWRDAMYGLALRLDPDQMQAIAALLYAEMLRFGITSVAEFHYLHHDRDGKPYAQRAEMGARLVAAAETAGIELTLLPVLYQRGGFEQPASASQRRFLCATLDDYNDLVAATCQAAAAGGRGVVVGTAVHSLRAVAAEDAKAVLSAVGTGPAHVHIAEQRREVADCLAHLGRRPVEWLLDNVALDARHHLVHATHLTDEECDRLARTRASVVVCPSTEGNLGDGFFPLERFTKAGGSWSIGTDSHIALSPFEDLRWIDYGQRLRVERRNALCARGGDDSGRIVFDTAWTAGRRALGRDDGEYFAVGRAFDAVVVDPGHPVLIGKPAERRLSALVYAGDPTCLLGTLRRGRWVVREQRHERQGELRSAYERALRALT